MTPFKKYFVGFFSINMLLLMMFSCTGVPILNINYATPGKTNQLAGKKVFLEVVDSRPDKDILGPGAKEDYNTLSENISLSVAEGDEKGFKIGLFHPKALMEEIFKERFKSMGMDVVTDSNTIGDRPKVVIDIQTLKLDLIKSTIKKTWTGKMVYNVEISYLDKSVKVNEISGEYEELKIFGKKEADSLLSNLVTDLVNRLDVEALFRQAGII